MAVLTVRGCVILRWAAVGYAYPKSHPSGELVVIHLSESQFLTAFLSAVLSASLLHGLQIQSDWKKQALKQFKCWPISYTNTLILHQSSVSVARFFSQLL